MDEPLDTPWPDLPAGKLKVTDAGLCDGGLAERLFRRMGSTPAAAALLRARVSPITKVRQPSVGNLECCYDFESGFGPSNKLLKHRLGWGNSQDHSASCEVHA